MSGRDQKPGVWLADLVALTGSRHPIDAALLQDQTKVQEWGRHRGAAFVEVHPRVTDERPYEVALGTGRMKRRTDRVLKRGVV